MACKRVIKSDLFEDDFVGSLSFFERLLWIGLFAQVADDQGRFWDNPLLIRAEIFPYDQNLTDDKVDQALDKFAKAGKVERYEADGKGICQLLNWWKHQRPSWASPSDFPALTGWVDREKYHVGKNVVTNNWDCSGGYCAHHSGEIGTEIGIKIGSCIPIETVVSSKRQDASSKRKDSSGGGNINIFRLYEENIGPIKPMLADELKDYEERHPYRWIAKAFKIAVDNNKRRWSYVRAILDRYEEEGYGSKPKWEKENNGNNSGDSLQGEIEAAKVPAELSEEERAAVAAVKERLGRS
jgi:DnaD/phage-associated family protein